MAVAETEAGARAVEDFLEHHGVKGMKWGVRKAEKAQSQADRAAKYADRRPTRGTQRKAERLQRRADKKFAKVDKKWEKSIYSTEGAVAVHNATASRVNAQLDALNDGPKYGGKNLLQDPALYKEYVSEYEAMVTKAYTDAVQQVHGVSPSGRKRATFVADDIMGDRIEVRNVDVKHSDDNEPDLIFLLQQDDGGHVLEMNQASNELSHIDQVEDFLEHYGVKGMRWGVKKDPQVVEVKAVAGRKVKTKGGQKHMPTEEAIRAATIKQQAKKSTTDSLSNKELQDAITRMNLEQQYSRLTADQRSVGRKLLGVILGEVGDKEVGQLTDFANSKTSSHPATGFGVRTSVKVAKTAVGTGGNNKKK